MNLLKPGLKIKNKTMEDSLDIAPISKVFEVIDSCINENQLDTCRKMAVYYARLAKEKGVVNPEVVKQTLDLKIEEKRTELEYCESFC